MKNVCLFYTVFQVLKGLLSKSCRIQLQLFCFLLFYISFYIRRCNFSQLFITLLSIIWVNVFVTNFPFLTDSPETVNGENEHDKILLSIFPDIFVRPHYQILFLPRNHQKTKQIDWFTQITLILEAKCWTLIQ